MGDNVVQQMENLNVKDNKKVSQIFILPTFIEISWPKFDFIQKMWYFVESGTLVESEVMVEYFMMYVVSVVLCMENYKTIMFFVVLVKSMIIYFEINRCECFI